MIEGKVDELYVQIGSCKRGEGVGFYVGSKHALILYEALG